MSSYPYSTNRTAGIMNADELAELRQVFNEACRQSRMAPTAAPAKFIASGLLTAFRASISNRELLLRLVSHPGITRTRLPSAQETLTEIDLDLVTSARSIPLNCPCRRHILMKNFLAFLATDSIKWILILMLAGIAGTILYLALTSITW